LYLQQVRLGTSRDRSGSLAYVSGMSETSNANPSLEPVLTTSELAPHLRVPVQTIHDLRHAQRGPRGFRVGREMCYRLSEVQAWVEDMEAHDHAADLVEGVVR
jgi:predicted DNA-binding transcriptional regulator AlpA